MDRAIDCYEKALRIEPNSALVRAKLVLAMVARVHLGQNAQLLTRAERLGREAIQLNPKLGETHRALGSLYSEKGDFSVALEQVIDAIELQGLGERPACFAGMISKMVGRPDMALRWYGIAKHWQSHPADGEFILGDCWCDLADDRRAEPFYKRVADLHPELPESWMGMCRIRLLQGDFDAARKIYRENASGYQAFAFSSEMAAQVEFFSRNNAEAEPRRSHGLSRSALLHRLPARPWIGPSYLDARLAFDQPAADDPGLYPSDHLGLAADLEVLVRMRREPHGDLGRSADEAEADLLDPFVGHARARRRHAHRADDATAVEDRRADACDPDRDLLEVHAVALGAGRDERGVERLPRRRRVGREALIWLRAEHLGELLRLEMDGHGLAERGRVDGDRGARHVGHPERGRALQDLDVAPGRCRGGARG